MMKRKHTEHHSTRNVVLRDHCGKYLRLEREDPATWSVWVDDWLQATLFSAGTYRAKPYYTSSLGSNEDHRWDLWTEGHKLTVLHVHVEVSTTKTLILS
jgi:hypothetical protein